MINITVANVGNIQTHFDQYNIMTLRTAKTQTSGAIRYHCIHNVNQALSFCCRQHRLKSYWAAQSLSSPV